MGLDFVWPEEASPLAEAWEGAEQDIAGGASTASTAHTDFQRWPVEWIVEKLDIPEHTVRWSLAEGYPKDHEWDGDRDPIVRVLESLAAGRDVGVESATGTGKTFIGACIVLWFLACWQDSIVVTAAPKEDQLLLHIWKEIGRLWPRFQRHFPEAELLTGKLRMKPAAGDKETWAATAFVCGVGASEESATKAQGFHAEHMLIITEETPGVHPAVMTAFENTRTDDHNLHLAFGNPDHQLDPLHQFCIREEVEHIRISALDHPNIVTGRSVVPGAIGRKRLDARRKRYGEDSRLWQSRGRGISPAEAEDALIRWAWCEAAAERWSDPGLRVGLPALGVDVANSENGDKAAIAYWQGACLTHVDSFPCPDASLLGVRVAGEMRSELDPSASVEPKHVGVDSVGVGASTVNKLKELGKRVKALNGGSRAAPGVDEDVKWQAFEEDEEQAQRWKPKGPTVFEEERYNNLRSQMWWQMRDDLRLGRVALPRDEELWKDLTTPTYRTHGGKIIVESKEDLYARLKRSPDKGDAAVYGNWVRRRKPLDPGAKPKKDRNTDDGLERLIARIHKQQGGRR